VKLRSLLAALLLGGSAFVPLTSAQAATPPPTQPPGPPVQVQTRPPVAGFPITLDTETVRTDASGRATFTSTDHNTVVNRLTYGEADVTFEGKDAHASGVKVYFKNEAVVTLALDISYRVSFRFTDLNGTVIDAPNVTSIRIKSSTGALMTVPAHGSSWLLGSRAIILLHDLIATDVMWTIQDVQYAGSNVVNSSQQQFFPRRSGDVAVKLLFYSTKLHARDAFFGFSVGKAVTLTYPDGSQQCVPLNRSGDVLLPSLPRGNYDLVVHALGPGIHRPLAVSRNQQVDLKVYTWLDISVAVLGIFAFTAGLVLAGNALHRRRLRRMAPASEEEQVPPSTGLAGAEP
jgi:hypothetical protein